MTGPLVAAMVVKCITLLIGFGICYLGYRLFMAGVNNNSGSLEGGGERFKLALKSAAPGTFFAVLGAAVLLVATYRGLSVNIREITDPDGRVITYEEEVEEEEAE